MQADDDILSLLEARGAQLAKETQARSFCSLGLWGIAC